MSADPWHSLRRLTAARIALGRTGGSLPTRERLDFALAHARARDAVHAPFDAPSFAGRLGRLGLEALCVESAAVSMEEFLRRPDLGRTLAESSRVQLTARASAAAPDDGCELVIIVSDGLSSRATTAQVEPLLAALLPLARQSGWRLAPLVVVSRGRVALQDEIGAIFGARASLMLLGERPGLGAADSLGAYFTYAPRPGLTDANRNCVSNIRPGGLPPVEAADKLVYLLTEALRRRLGGVELKDDAPVPPSSLSAAGASVLPGVRCHHLD